VSPWLSIVLLGVAITGYAWMMPKTSSREKEPAYVNEAAYDRLLEDLETENRELVDAVAKFKREQDETVEKLGRRIVDMEHQMKKWLEQSPASATPPSVLPPIVLQDSSTSQEIFVSTPVIEPSEQEPLNPIAPVVNEVALPPTTIRGRYPELLVMHDKGRSIEQIAKAMGMNKGEVQLILQLVRREEQQNA
jgi:hypothetical protein